MENSDNPAARDDRRTSVLLRTLVLEHPAPFITLGDLLDNLGDRAFGFLMFLLAFPVCLPMPPGFSTIMGFLILPIAFQFLLGKSAPQLPRIIRNHPIDRAVLAKAVRIILPGLMALEKLLRPRWHGLTRGWGEKCTAIVILLLILELITPLPPPLHFLPAGGIALMALGLMESDGVMIAIGGIAGIGGLAAVGVLGRVILGWVSQLSHWWGMS